MTLRRFKERFRGREFWRSINTFIGVSLYTVFLVGIMAFPMFLGYLILGYVVVIPSYVAFFINHLRDMERQKKGIEVLGGWVEHDHGQGERFYFYVEEIQPYEKLSDFDQKKVKELVDLLVDQAKIQKKIPVGDKKPEPMEQIPFKVPTPEEFEKLDDEERNKIEAGWEKLSEQLTTNKEQIKMDKIKKLADKIVDGEQENDN